MNESQQKLDDLDIIEARANAAKPAPWAKGSDVPDIMKDHDPNSWGHSYEDDIVSVNADPSNANPYFRHPSVVSSWGHDADGVDIDEADRDFIIHARSDVPALIAEVRRLRGLLDVK